MQEPTSPTITYRPTRSMGPEKFNQRREMFDQSNTIILPKTDYSKPAVTKHKKSNSMVEENGKRDEIDRVVLRSEENTTFERNKAYSSLRDNRTQVNSLKDQTDDRRKFMSERTQRLSRLRQEFLASNLHSSSLNAFERNKMRASLPVGRVAQTKVEFTPHKFPFAEPYATPQTVRKQFLKLSDEEHEKSDASDASGDNNKKDIVIDHQKVYKELMERYSPPRKEVNWDFPPTKPLVVNNDIVSTPLIAETIDTKQTKSEVDDKARIVNAVEKPPRKIVSKDTTIPEILEKISPEPQILPQKCTTTTKKLKKKNFLARLFGKGKN